MNLGAGGNGNGMRGVGWLPFVRLAARRGKFR